MNRVARIGGPAAALVVAVLALLAALALGGAAAPLGIDDPGPVVRFALPIAQLVVNLAAATTLGPLVLAAFALKPGERSWGRALDLAAGGAAVWTVASASSVVLVTLDFTGLPITHPDFGSQLLLYSTMPGPGGGWLATTLLAAVLTVLCIGVRSHTGVVVLVLAAIGSLIPMALQGHAASLNADHDAAVSALGLHIVFAAVWLGGLLWLCVAGRSEHGVALTTLVRRYSSIALVCYVVVAISGTVSAAIRLGSLAALFTSYGLLVTVKALVLIVLGAFGALYRVTAMARLDGERGRRWFFGLIGAELALMGIASGFAAALSRTPTPLNTVTANTASSPAEILTGQPLPPPPSFVLYLTTWHLDLIWVLLCGFLLFFYLAGVRRLHRRGDRWPLHRTILWTLGIAVLFWLTNGGLNTYEKFLFSSHMLLHMLLTMVVPLLLVPAAPITLALRTIRRRTDGTRGGREWLLVVVHSRVSTWLSNPVVAAVLFAGSLVVFYYTPIFSWATTDHVGHEWMTTHFLITGYLFVQALIGVDPVPGRAPYPFRLLVLLATMAFHAFFGLSLLNGTGLLLAGWYGAMGWGTNALADQHLGGGIAWSVGELPTLALAIVVAISWSRSDERDSKRLDRAADRSNNADLEAYNAMLARLDKSRV